ncbi:MAG: hypothetical protein MMC33_005710 [Icmadophila ericetorum]|nr:hypothetical protein [Icmadophila ericetorum]
MYLLSFSLVAASLLSQVLAAPAPTSPSPPSLCSLELEIFSLFPTQLSAAKTYCSSFIRPTISTLSNAYTTQTVPSTTTVTTIYATQTSLEVDFATVTQTSLELEYGTVTQTSLEVDYATVTQTSLEVDFAAATTTVSTEIDTEFDPYPVTATEVDIFSTQVATVNLGTTSTTTATIYTSTNVAYVIQGQGQKKARAFKASPSSTPTPTPTLTHTSIQAPTISVPAALSTFLAYEQSSICSCLLTSVALTPNIVYTSTSTSTITVTTPYPVTALATNTLSLTSISTATNILSLTSTSIETDTLSLTSISTETDTLSLTSTSTYFQPVTQTVLVTVSTPTIASTQTFIVTEQNTVTISSDTPVTATVDAVAQVTSVCPIAPLTNGNFETGSFSPWTLSASAGGTAKVVANPTPGDSHGSYILNGTIIPSGTGSLAEFIYQGMNVCPNAAYTVSWDYQCLSAATTTANSPHMQVFLHYANPTQQLIIQTVQCTPATNGQWQNTGVIPFTMPNIPLAQLWITLTSSVGGPGTILMDNIIVNV